MEFNIFKKEKLPRAMRKLISPRREFIKNTRMRFLAIFDAHYHVHDRSASPFVSAYKIGVALAVFVAVTLGASVYADTQNVPADNPLYSLKRLNESVQLVFVKPENKPQLRMRLAARRTEEIVNLEQEDANNLVTTTSTASGAGNASSASSTSSMSSTSSASSTEKINNRDTIDGSNKRSSKKIDRSKLISSLAKDLHEEIDNSVKDAEESDLKDERLDDFCGKLRSTIAASSSVIRREFSIHSEALRRFERKCGEEEGSGDENDGGDPNATSTLDATSTNRFRIRNQRDGKGEKGDEGGKGKRFNSNLNFESRSSGKAGTTTSTSSDGNTLNVDSSTITSASHFRVNVNTELEDD